MSKGKLVLNKKGVKELLQSNEMKNEVDAIAKEEARKEYGKYFLRVFVGWNRIKAMAYPKGKGKSK